MTEYVIEYMKKIQYIGDEGQEVNSSILEFDYIKAPNIAEAAKLAVAKHGDNEVTEVRRRMTFPSSETTTSSRKQKGARR